MKLPLLTLFLATLLVRCEPAHAAQLDGAVRLNVGTTGTNTTGAAVTITGRTNLNTGTLNSTNSVNVGRSGETGVLQLTSTNGTYTLSQSLLANGAYVITNDGSIALLIPLSSGYAGGGTKFLTDGAGYVTPSSPIGNVTNININPTDGYVPYRSNATTFGDSPLYRIDADQMGFGGTNWQLVLNSSNTLVGRRTLYSLSGARDNVSLGPSALNSLTSGELNTAIGKLALNKLTSGQQNTALGYEAGLSNTASQNVFLGYRSGRQNTSGIGNTYAGVDSGFSGITANQNTFIGEQAGWGNKADNGTIVGFDAGYVATNVARAVLIGAQPHGSSERLDKNYADSIIIGYKLDTNNVQAVTNAIYIGSGLVPVTSNEVQLGNATNTHLYLPYGMVQMGSATNVLYRSGTDLLYTNGAAQPNFKVVNGSAANLQLGLNAGGNGFISASSGAVFMGSQLDSLDVLPALNNTYRLGIIGANRYLSVAATDFYTVSGGRFYWNGPTNTVFDLAGVGSPEGVVAAEPGSVYRRFDGASGTTLYTKVSGSGTANWEPLSTAASTVTASSTNTFTNKTFDAADTGNVLKQIKSLKLQFPRRIDGTGCAYANTNDYTSTNFMLATFSGTAATNANWAEFAFRVPADLDTGVDLTASLTTQQGGTSTSTATFTVGMVSIANGSAAPGTAANYTTITVTPAAATAGAVTGSNGTALTGWRSNMTANQWCNLRISRDGGDSNNDTQSLMELEIFYTSTQ